MVALHRALRRRRRRRRPAERERLPLHLRRCQSQATHMIERLILPAGDPDLRALAQLLADAVDSGAAVSFLAPITLERAEDWWRKAVSASHSTRPGHEPAASRRDCEVGTSPEPPQGPGHSADANH